MKKGIKERLNKYYLGALIDAVRRDDGEIVKLLIENHNLDINDSEDRSYQSPLHFAVVYESNKAAKILVDSGADCYKRDSDGETPLDFANQKGDIKMVNILNGARE